MKGMARAMAEATIVQIVRTGGRSADVTVPMVCPVCKGMARLTKEGAYYCSCGESEMLNLSSPMVKLFKLYL